jgi:ribose transport system substrate-binding protein
LLTSTALAAALAISAGAAHADTSDKRIALSNNYAGNSWRQAMLRSWDKVTKPAVEQGIVAAADAFTTAENQVTEQAAQIQNLVLQGYDAIVLNAASPDALNGAVKEACDAGVIVVSLDGIVTEPWRLALAVDFKQMGKTRSYTTKTSFRRGQHVLENPRAAACSSLTRSRKATTRASPRTPAVISKNRRLPSMGTGSGQGAGGRVRILPSQPTTSSPW